MNDRIRNDCTIIGLLCWRLGMVRFYRDGTGYSILFRWWHPLSWIVWIVTIQICGIVGEEVNRAIPFRLSPYWREHKKEIEWL